MFQRYFIHTYSNVSQTSALILFIKDKMLVEFSDVGALYVYSHDHRMVKTVTQSRDYITSTASLKIPSMNQIIESNGLGSYYYAEEGRMSHLLNWQERLKGWMKEIVLSKPHVSTFFADTDNEDLFKAVPLLKEEVQKGTEENDVIKDQYVDDFQDQKRSYEVKKDCKVHEEYVEGKLSSNKPIEEVNCRLELIHGFHVIVATDGFYIKNAIGNLILLKKSVQVVSSIKKIWLTDSSNLDWAQIFYLKNDNSVYSIGFLRIGENTIDYKEYEDDISEINIPIKNEGIVTEDSNIEDDGISGYPSNLTKNRYEVAGKATITNSVNRTKIIFEKDVLYNVSSKSLVNGCRIVLGPKGLYVFYNDIFVFICNVFGYVRRRIDSILIEKTEYGDWMNVLCFMRMKSESYGYICVYDKVFLYKKRLSDIKCIRIDFIERKKVYFDMPADYITQKTITNKQRTMIRYEKNIELYGQKINLSNGSSVFIGKKGIYISCSNNEYAMIKRFSVAQKNIYKMMIEQNNESGWYQVFYFSGSERLSAGYINLTKNEVVYKQLITDSNVNVIRIH